MLQHEELKKAAERVGFDLCGVVAVRPLEEDAARFRRWVAAGHHSSLAYLERNTDKRFDPALLVEGAKSIIVCAVSYKNAISEGYEATHRAKIASYACNHDYHTTLKSMLHELFGALQSGCPTLAGRGFVDSAPVAEKRWAVEAGFGWIGRQSLLITPRYGSFVHLCELIINEEFDHYDQPMQGVGCGSCRACIEACPTGAILENERMISTARCIACHTIERQPATRIDLDGWIFGCDSCQTCCPHNRRTPMHRHVAFDPLFDSRNMTSEDWLSMSEEAFSQRFATTPLTRSGLKRIKENVEEERGKRKEERGKSKERRELRVES